jgi:predicted phosphodiesterase
MKIAFITDSQGNYTAFQTVLDTVTQQRPDTIIFGGDMINPYLGSKQILDIMKASKIPCVLGNQEDWVLQYHSETPNDRLKHSIQFMPTQHTAKQLVPDDIDYLKQLPRTFTLNHPEQPILFCHASPSDLWESFGEGISEEMDRKLSTIDASVIVCGHLHRTFELGWNGKLLVIAGSCGMPLKNKHHAEYVMLEYTKHDWYISHKSIRYDADTEITHNLHNGFLRHGGPIAWLMIDELILQRDHLTPFFQHLPQHHMEETRECWERYVRDFLTKIGRWEPTEALIKKYT